MTTAAAQTAPRTVRAPRGSTMSCKTWQAEAAMRMLMNNLDPQVAERPQDLVVYGGRGQAVRSWAAFDAIVETLKRLEPDETLLVQSGKPVGVCRTTPDAPRVLIANSNLVPHWATQDNFDELARKGLIMFGQMTAGSWIYIGTQGILQGTYETFAECARQHFGGTLKGRLCVTAGCGGMGGAQPLAVSMNEGVCLLAEMCIERLQRRVHDRYLDEIHHDLDAAIERALSAKVEGRALSVGWLGNAVDLLEALVKRNVMPDALTDQTSAHDPLNGYYPQGLSRDQADKLRASDPTQYAQRSMSSMGRHVELMVELKKRGTHTFDYGNNIRQRVAFQGLPARICWLGLGERDKAGLRFNELVRDGVVKAPIVIGRDHLDAGSVASPNRETESMKDGSDAVSDWPLLNAMINVAGGASWVSFHHGGGVGIGFAQHAGQVIVADGTDEAAARLKRVLTNDPLTGIFRHVDAGYDLARQCAAKHDVNIPMDRD